MPFGYSNRFVNTVQERYRATPDDPVVQMCYLCIQNDIMMSDAAERLDVSKQTIYNWLSGEYRPKADAVKRIEALNRKLKKNSEKAKV